MTTKMKMVIKLQPRRALGLACLLGLLIFYLNTLYMANMSKKFAQSMGCVNSLVHPLKSRSPLELSRIGYCYWELLYSTL